MKPTLTLSLNELTYVLRYFLQEKILEGKSTADLLTACCQQLIYQPRQTPFCYVLSLLFGCTRLEAPCSPYTQLLLIAKGKHSARTVNVVLQNAHTHKNKKNPKRHMGAY